MKKFFYKLPIWATCFCVLLCTVLSINIQPSFASTPRLRLALLEEQIAPYYYPVGAFTQLSGAVYNGTLGWYGTEPDSIIPSGYYSVSGNINGIMNSDVTAAEVMVLGVRLLYNGDEYVGEEAFYIAWYDFSEVFYIPESSDTELYAIFAQSFTVPNLLPIEEEEPLYYSAFEMLADFIYGNDHVLTAEQNMTLTILATLAALFVVLFPFLIVFFVVRFITWLR